MSGAHFATYVEDLEQNPFNATDFVERLAWRMTGGKDNITDPIVLKNKFEEEIASLQMLCDQFANKIGVLEQQLSKDKREYCQQLQRLHEQNADAINKMKQLDSTMQTVSSKVIHLGDQLESVNDPRMRAHDTLQLISHFNEFLSDQPLNSDMFTDPDKLLESADLIQKLYSISQELNKDKYAAVQARITHRYNEVEELLVEEFSRLYEGKHDKEIAEVAKVLSEFKGYTTCVNKYVDFITNQSAFKKTHQNIYENALHLVRSARPRIEAIFPHPGTVLNKLILHIFHGWISEVIHQKLDQDSKDMNVFLPSLKDEFGGAKKLVDALDAMHVCSEPNLLDGALNSLFGVYLSTYPTHEAAYLNKQCSEILQKFYDDKKHQKKQVQAGGLQELKRDVTARLLTVENWGGETFIDEYPAIDVAHEFEASCERATKLLSDESLCRLLESIFDIFLQHLHYEFLDYGVELARSGITLAEPKTEPPVHFFNVVRNNTDVIFLMSQQYTKVQDLTKDTMFEGSVHRKWQAVIRSLENKVSNGIERQLNAVIGYIRFVLNSQQKKADFVPDAAQLNLGISSTCQTIIRFLSTVVNAIESGCDGPNRENVLEDLASRFHKLLLTHYQQFQYSSAGAMLLLCDLNEYRRHVSKWPYSPESIRKPFDSLHSLANLLVILPDNLNQTIASGQLDEVDRSLIHSFLQLRIDYRSLKIKPY